MALSMSSRLWAIRVASGVTLALATQSCAFSHPNPASQARMLVAKGQSQEAAKQLEAYLKEHPEAVSERRLLIRVYATLGQLGQAQTQAETLARRLGPQSPIPWVELGFALELSHRYDEALEQYDRAGEVAPRDALGPVTGGLRAARWGEPALAEPRLVEGLRRDPRNAEAWHALGLVRARLGNLDGADLAYRSGLRADPSALENHVGLASLALLRGDAAAALAEYDLIVSSRPRFADAHLGRSWALMRLGRLDDAQQALDRARDLGASPRPLNAQRHALAALRSMH
jgi:tetratricopeptide (TPR) repeat protein